MTRTAMWMGAALTMCAATLAGQGTCSTGSAWSPLPGVTHQVYKLVDPAGEQTALFDIEWGGALASLTYVRPDHPNREYVWGNATGAMVQPAWFAVPITYPDYDFYNPTQAGDVANRGTPILGGNCVAGSALLIMASASDYLPARAAYGTGNAVKNGALVFGMLATPYAIVTSVSFVPNPSGPPSYYLKMTQTVSNLHWSENFPSSYRLANYVPHAFSTSVRYPANCSTPTSPCLGPNTPTLAGGLYLSADLSDGLAFSTSPQSYFTEAVNHVWVPFGEDPVNLNWAGNLASTTFFVAPGTSRSYNWYLYVGPWDKALAYAQTHN